MMATERKFTVLTTARQIEAHIIKGRLESEGIPTFLNYESAGLVYGITIDGLGEVRIMVPTEFIEKARDILGEINK
jgi:hypothetical protein